MFFKRAKQDKKKTSESPVEAGAAETKAAADPGQAPVEPAPAHASHGGRS